MAEVREVRLGRLQVVGAGAKANQSLEFQFKKRIELNRHFHGNFICFLYWFQSPSLKIKLLIFFFIQQGGIVYIMSFK